MDDLFTQMLKTAATEKEERAETVKKTAQVKKRELSKKEQTNAIKNEITHIEEIEKEAEKSIEDSKAIKKDLNLTQELSLNLDLDEKVSTVQYMITPSLKKTIDEAYTKYKKLNPKITKGGLVEYALRNFLGMDDTEVKNKMGIK